MKIAPARSLHILLKATKEFPIVLPARRAISTRRGMRKRPLEPAAASSFELGARTRAREREREKERERGYEEKKKRELEKSRRRLRLPVAELCAFLCYSDVQINSLLSLRRSRRFFWTSVRPRRRRFKSESLNLEMREGGFLSSDSDESSSAKYGIAYATKPDNLAMTTTHRGFFCFRQRTNISL